MFLLSSRLLCGKICSNSTAFLLKIQEQQPGRKYEKPFWWHSLSTGRDMHYFRNHLPWDIIFYFNRENKTPMRRRQEKKRKLTLGDFWTFQYCKFFCLFRCQNINCEKYILAAGESFVPWSEENFSNKLPYEEQLSSVSKDPTDFCDVRGGNYLTTKTSFLCFSSLPDTKNLLLFAKYLCQISNCVSESCP